MRGQLPIGSILAGYRIVELIGEGSGGAVYLAEQEETGEPVALKVLADELAHDDRFRRRFLRESTIAAGQWWPAPGPSSIPARRIPWPHDSYAGDRGASLRRA